MSDITINIGKDFSRFPVGRYSEDGDANGQLFRDNFLVPKLSVGSKIRIELDDALGYGSSFLEEAFGGLVRAGFEVDNLKSLLDFVTEDDSLREEILGYMRDAAQ